MSTSESMKRALMRLKFSVEEIKKSVSASNTAINEKLWYDALDSVKELKALFHLMESSLEVLKYEDPPIARLDEEDEDNKS